MTERRRYDRYDIHRPMQYRAEKGWPAGESVTLNISARGALIATKRALARGARLIVRIAMREMEFFLRSRVAHVEREKAGVYLAGIEFLDPPTDFTYRYYSEVEVHILDIRRSLESNA